MYTLGQKVRYRIRRFYLRRLYLPYYKWRFGYLDLPIIFGNSFPKSGTNLLLQILQGFKQIGPFLDRDTFIVTYRDDRRRMGYRRFPQEIVRDIHSLVPGEIAGGHLHATRENVSALIRPTVVNYFIYRDPRDVVQPHAYAVTQSAHRNRLHHSYAKVLSSTEERITTSILGTPDADLECPDIRRRWEPFADWLEVGKVMPIRFEELICDRKGVIGRILDHFLDISSYPLPLTREETIDVLTRCIDPAKSPTFREGKAGGWRKYFTDEHKALFKEVTGDLLIQLGYERDVNW